MKKYCSYHKAYHDVSEFGKNIKSKDGLHQYCKKARKEMNKKMYDRYYKTVVKKKVSKKDKDIIHYSNYFKASLADDLSHWSII